MAKWLNKKRQAIKEMSNKETKHTELEPGFHKLEAETDATLNALEGLVKKVPYYLHPDPTQRLRSGLKKSPEARYKHAIINIAEVCSKQSHELLEAEPDSGFGKALGTTAEALDQMRDLQYNLDDEVNQQFLSPIKEVLEKQAKDIAHHRKKTRTRRLDYDFKKNANDDNKEKGKPLKYNDSDMKVAEEKFKASYSSAELAMAALVDGETEQISQLSAFVQAHLNFFEQAHQVFENVKANLDSLVAAGPTKAKAELSINQFNARVSDGALSGVNVSDVGASAYSDDEEPPSPAAGGGGGGGGGGGAISGPRANALYDFEAENPGELDFKEGDVIALTQRIDENWLEGTLNGKNGMFPSNYVEVVEEP